MITKPCDIVIQERFSNKIKVFSVNDDRCRYHRLKSKGVDGNIISKGMCPLAYLNLYPVLFALHTIRNASRQTFGSESLLKRCPLGDDGVLFSIFFEPHPFRTLSFMRNSFSRLMNIFIPFDVHNKIVGAQIVVAGSCPLCMEKGQRFVFNVDKTDEICPAAVNSIYPLLGEDTDFILGCPDYRTHVKYNTVALPLRASPGGKPECDSYTQKVKITRKIGDFPCPLEPDCWYEVDELLRIIKIPCFTSYHVAFPYLYALSKGGQLGYLSRNRMEAGICCPNAELAIQYMVSKSEESYFYRSTKTHPECPRNVLLNDVTLLKDFIASLPFYTALNELYIILKKTSTMHDSELADSMIVVESREGKMGLNWVIANGPIY